LPQTVPAILEGFYLGQEGGTAVADVLFGDANPGGKLPITFPRATGQLPVYYDRKPTSFRSYLDLTREPLFAFGHGLSYTTFKLENVKVAPEKIGPAGEATVTVDVTNTGSRAGDEVVQLYSPRPRRLRHAPGQGAARVRARHPRSRRKQDGHVQGRPGCPALHRRADEPRGRAGPFRPDGGNQLEDDGDDTAGGRRQEDAMSDAFEPRPEHKFTFGLWTVGNPGRDPFGEPVRPVLSPVEIVRLLAEVGAYGVNFHDDDLIPIDASPADRDRIVRDFKKALAETGLKVPMATTNLFTDPSFKDGAFTSNDARVRAYALQKVMRNIDLGVELGAKVYVFWGGREGVETDASKDPLVAINRNRDAMNFLTSYVKDQKYDLVFALEAKPNEPRHDIYLPTTGALLAFIETLDHPEMVGVNPEVAHEHMSGLNFMHAIAQAWDAKKLFHIDLNDQAFGRYDQDLRFGSHSLKSCFFMVKFLEDVGYAGSRHFDSHAYRTEDVAGREGLRARSMRSYLIYKDKGRRWNEGQGDPGPGEGGLRGAARRATRAGRVQPGDRGCAEGPRLRSQGAGGARSALRASGSADGRGHPRGEVALGLPRAANSAFSAG
jgi:xylose isomerase